MIWIWVLLVVAVCVILLMLSKAEVNFVFKRIHHDDELDIKFKALYGLVQYRFHIPVINYKSFADGVLVRMEEMNDKTGTKLAEQSDKIDRHKIEHFYRDFKQLVKHVFGFSKWLQQTVCYLHCSRFRWVTNLGLGDAAETAITTGFVWGVKGSIVGYIFKRIKLDAKPQVAVFPNYNRPQFTTELECVLTIRLGYSLWAGFLLLIRILKVKGGFRTWREILIQRVSSPLKN